MDADQAISTVNEILATEFEVDRRSLVPAAKLRDDLGLDSLDAVDFVVALEKAIGRPIPEDTAKKLHTVGDVYAHVRGG